MISRYMLRFSHRNLGLKSNIVQPRVACFFRRPRGTAGAARVAAAARCKTDWVGSWPQVAKEIIGDLLYRSLEDQHEIIGDTGIS